MDEKSAARAGQIRGLEAIVIGSAMKVGETITISGRLIDSQSAEILTSGTVYVHFPSSKLLALSFGAKLVINFFVQFKMLLSISSQHAKFMRDT